ncbi:MAG: extracellular solute-binding protein [Lachnospiraceae bacterium]|nr:extracellular solute-binding protein [Lachnospiraceae bacterium]
MEQKKIRINILLSLLTILIVWMAGCGKNEAQDPLNTTMEMPLSTYRFTETHEVAGLNSGNAFFRTMIKTEDGFSILYTDMEGNLSECHTSDGGATWNENTVALDFVDGENWSVSESDRNAAGEYALLIMQMNEDYAFNGFQVMFAGKNDSRLIVEYDDGISKVCFNEAGDAILVCTKYEVEEYGVDGRLLRSYPVTDVMDMCFIGQEIVFLTNDAIRVYDETSGEMVTEDSGFHEMLADELSPSNDVLNNHEMMRSDGNEAVYILLNSGMYRYVPGSSVIECIYGTSKSGVDRLDNTLSFAREGDLFYLLGYLENDDTLYFLCCSEMDEAVEPVENVPAEEITVYTLYSQEYLEYTVRQFEEKYPDIKVNIEVGREEGSNTTIAEAINALNTQLLAGNGPDVIIMDDLNYAAYRDSGMLKELSGLYEEIISDNPGIITTILSCYRTEDGELYAIPSQFEFSVISAPIDSIDSLNSLEGLAEYIQNSPCPNPEFGNDLRIYDAKGLFQLLYPAYSSRIFVNGESYDRQELENFVSGMKEVWDALMEHTTEDQIREWEALVDETEEEWGDWVYSNTYYLMQGLVDEWGSLGMGGGPLIRTDPQMQLYSGRSIGLYHFNTEFDVEDIWHMMNEYPHETYDIFAIDDVNTFTPLMVYSINAKSENTDAAEEFVKYMLSMETQSNIGGDYDYNFEHRFGMSVNMEALLSRVETFKYYNNGSPIPVAPEGEVERFMDLLGSFSVPTYRNAILEEKIFSGLEDYLNGRITLEQYMEETDNAITLYMEE